MSAGLYLHIPFCEHKCGYCDFYSATDIDRFGNEFIKALLKEIKQTESNLEFDTIFFGGGTPSLLTPHQLEQIVDHLYSQFKIKPDSEITIETNPGTVDLEKLKSFKQLGINRISFGVQSFHADELKFMERIHSSDQAIIALLDAEKAGFENLSIDLIFALPNQTIEKWKSNLKIVETLPIQHISAYNLIIEPNTPFANLERDGIIRNLDQDLERHFFEFTIEAFDRLGFKQYEISNYARAEQFQSKHNLKYWKMDPYFGFGPSAHSYDGVSKRWWNIRSTQKYIEQVDITGKAIIKEEVLKKEEQILETLMQSFRLRTGLDMNRFNLHFNMDFKTKFSKSISHYKSLGLLDITNNHCYLTAEGQYYCNEILRNF